MILLITSQSFVAVTLATSKHSFLWSLVSSPSVDVINLHQGTVLFDVPIWIVWCTQSTRRCMVNKVLLYTSTYFLFSPLSPVSGDLAHNRCRLSGAELHLVLGTSRPPHWTVLLLVLVPSSSPHCPVWGQSSALLSSGMSTYTECSSLCNNIRVIFLNAACSIKQYMN